MTGWQRMTPRETGGALNRAAILRETGLNAGEPRLQFGAAPHGFLPRRIATHLKREQLIANLVLQLPQLALVVPLHHPILHRSAF